MEASFSSHGSKNLDLHDELEGQSILELPQPPFEELADYVYKIPSLKSSITGEGVALTALEGLVSTTVENVTRKGVEWEAIETQPKKVMLKQQTQLLPKEFRFGGSAIIQEDAVRGPGLDQSQVSQKQFFSSLSTLKPISRANSASQKDESSAISVSGQKVSLKNRKYHLNDLSNVFEKTEEAINNSIEVSESSEHIRPVISKIHIKKVDRPILNFVHEPKTSEGAPTEYHRKQEEISASSKMSDFVFVHEPTMRQPRESSGDFTKSTMVAKVDPLPVIHTAAISENASDSSRVKQKKKVTTLGQSSAQKLNLKKMKTEALKQKANLRSIHQDFKRLSREQISSEQGHQLPLQVPLPQVPKKGSGQFKLFKQVNLPPKKLNMDLIEDLPQKEERTDRFVIHKIHFEKTPQRTRNSQPESQIVSGRKPGSQDEHVFSTRSPALLQTRYGSDKKHLEAFKLLNEIQSPMPIKAVTLITKEKKLGIPKPIPPFNQEPDFSEARKNLKRSQSLKNYREYRAKIREASKFKMKLQKQDTDRSATPANNEMVPSEVSVGSNELGIDENLQLLQIKKNLERKFNIDVERPGVEDYLQDKAYQGKQGEHLFRQKMEEERTAERCANAHKPPLFKNKKVERIQKKLKSFMKQCSRYQYDFQFTKNQQLRPSLNTMSNPDNLAKYLVCSNEFYKTQAKAHSDVNMIGRYLDEAPFREAMKEANIEQAEVHEMIESLSAMEAKTDKIFGRVANFPSEDFKFLKKCQLWEKQRQQRLSFKQIEAEYSGQKSTEVREKVQNKMLSTLINAAKAQKANLAQRTFDPKKQANDLYSSSRDSRSDRVKMSYDGLIRDHKMKKLGFDPSKGVRQAKCLSLEPMNLKMESDQFLDPSTNLEVSKNREQLVEIKREVRQGVLSKLAGPSGNEKLVAKYKKLQTLPTKKKIQKSQSIPNIAPITFKEINRHLKSSQQEIKRTFKAVKAKREIEEKVSKASYVIQDFYTRYKQKQYIEEERRKFIERLLLGREKSSEEVQQAMAQGKAVRDSDVLDILRRNNEKERFLNEVAQFIVANKKVVHFV